MPDTWVSEKFPGGNVTFVPGNPGKGYLPGIRVQDTGPVQEIILRGPALKALVDFLQKHQDLAHQVLTD